MSRDAPIEKFGANTEFKLSFTKSLSKSLARLLERTVTTLHRLLTYN